MTKNAKSALAMVPAAVFLGLTADYFPPTRMGFVLYTILLVLALYPVFRTSGEVTDKQFLLGALIFVPANLVMREFQQYLPRPLIRYSAAVAVALAFVALATGLRKRPEQ